VQLLLVFRCVGAFVAGQYVLKQWGRPVARFGRGADLVDGVWHPQVAVNPPLPSTLLYTYMGMVTVATFFYVSATEEGWAQCLGTIKAFFTRDTPWFRAIRVGVFTLFPALTAWAVYSAIVPPFEAPMELMNTHAAPPRTITVHGERIDLQTAKNPFRVDESVRPTTAPGE
jgi:hypothetical protein